MIQLLFLLPFVYMMLRAVLSFEESLYYVRVFLPLVLGFLD